MHESASYFMESTHESAKIEENNLHKNASFIKNSINILNFLCFLLKKNGEKFLHLNGYQNLIG